MKVIVCVPPPIIKLIRLTAQAENVRFMTNVVLNTCACVQCQSELAEEIETLRADWQYIFSIN